MQNRNQELEYAEFVIKLGDKVRELRSDYSKLSLENQQRFISKMELLIAMNVFKISDEDIQKVLLG